MSLVEYSVLRRVAIVTLNRPEVANAQNESLLQELDSAFDRAVADEQVRVIILNANGEHFSAGHDLSPPRSHEEASAVLDDVPANGMLRLYRWEMKNYLGLCRKWRDLPKPTIAAVQGACIGGGLMLVWPCDLILAGDDARFSDPVVRMGIGGVEYHAHTWEVGARKAKEMLFTAREFDAHEAHRLGMVNRVVPRDELDSAALALAEEIAQMHPHALLMAKQAVNQTLDAMGQQAAIQAGFTLHALGHANAWTIGGFPVLTRAGELLRKKKSAEPGVT